MSVESPDEPNDRTPVDYETVRPIVARRPPSLFAVLIITAACVGFASFLLNETELARVEPWAGEWMLVLGVPSLLLAALIAEIAAAVRQRRGVRVVMFVVVILAALSWGCLSSLAVSLSDDAYL